TVGAGADGFARIVYHTTSSEIKYVQCKNQSCSSNSYVTVPTSSGAGSIVAGNIAAFMRTDNQIRIFYINNNSGIYTIRQINCTLAATDTCSYIGNRYTLPAVSPVVIGTNRFAATRDSLNNPRLVLFWQENTAPTPTQRFNFFRCTSDCAAPNLTNMVAPLVSATTYWQSPSVTVSSTDLPLMAYWEVTGANTANFKYIQCTTTNCSSIATSSPLLILAQTEAAGISVNLSDITIASSGYPAMAFSWKGLTGTPNTVVTSCSSLSCATNWSTIAGLFADNQPKIIKVTAAGANFNKLRVFTSYSGGPSINMTQCGLLCRNQPPSPPPAILPQITVEDNGAMWAGAFVGSDGNARAVYNANPGGLGIKLRMGCDIEAGNACPQTFTISANAP
ncbi:MAG: hypothetical protein Q7T74_06255, partial [Candidatus Saccharibacteria bacterium]|nr:hypothetical protein [Candidatus Saccharibacteria bacterium]